MKYNPGDKVKIKSLDWYNENKISEISKFMKDQGIRSYVDCNGFRFLDVMCEYCGKILTVDFISEHADGSKSYIMREPAIGFGFTDDMIEGLADELQGEMVSLEKVVDEFSNFIIHHFSNLFPTGEEVKYVTDLFRKRLEE